jgi:hypothetical protein
MTTTTNLQTIEAVSLEAVTGGCHKGGGGGAVPPQMQQQAMMNRPPGPMGPPPDDGKVSVAVDYNGQQQQQTA